MKEATGELSTTMIAVVAIAAVLTIFTVVLLPYLRSSLNSRLHCADATCPTDCTDATCACTYINEAGAATAVTCNNPNHGETD